PEAVDAEGAQVHALRSTPARAAAPPRRPTPPRSRSHTPSRIQPRRARAPLKEPRTTPRRGGGFSGSATEGLLRSEPLADPAPRSGSSTSNPSRPVRPGAAGSEAA